MSRAQAKAGAAAALAVAALAAAAFFAGPRAAADDAGAAERTRRAREALERGIALLEQNDPRGALRDLAEAVDLAPDDPEARFALGLAYFLTDDHRRARPELLAVLDRAPRHSFALEYLGRIDYLEGDFASALARLRAAREAAPERAEIAELIEKIERERAIEATYEQRFTAHFHIRVEGGRAQGQIADRVAEALERAYDEVGHALGHRPQRRISVILYPDREFYEVTGAHAWVGGVFDGKIRIPVKGLLFRDDETLRRVARHEYVHACVFAVAPRAPTWLHEGLAQHFEGIRFEPGALLSEREDVRSIADLETTFLREPDPKKAARLYAQALGFVQFLIARRGPADMGAFLREIGAGAALDEAAERVYGEPLSALEAAWRATLR